MGFELMTIPGIMNGSASMVNSAKDMYTKVPRFRLFRMRHRIVRKISVERAIAELGTVPDVLKIDAEGSEAYILAGLLNIVKDEKSRWKLLWNIHRIHWSG
jgi:hypothetical protein